MPVCRKYVRFQPPTTNTENDEGDVLKLTQVEGVDFLGVWNPYSQQPEAPTFSIESHVFAKEAGGAALDSC